MQESPGIWNESLPEFALCFHNAFFRSGRLERNVNVAKSDLSRTTITMSHAGFLFKLHAESLWVLHKDWKPFVPGFVIVLVLCRSCYQHFVGKKAAWAISNWGQVPCKYWMNIWSGKSYSLPMWNCSFACKLLVSALFKISP